MENSIFKTLRALCHCTVIISRSFQRTDVDHVFKECFKKVSREDEFPIKI